MRVLTVNDTANWSEVLGRSYRFDFYHLPEYHALEEKRIDGRAFLFVHEEDCFTIALPLLLRPVPEYSVPEGEEGQLSDATSAYGYAGPLSSHLYVPERVAQNFRTNLAATLERYGVIAAFSRLHPIIDHVKLLAGMGQMVRLGQTVSIDLTRPLDEQRKKMRQNHRRDITKLRNAGVQCVEDYGLRYLECFVDVYQETMGRVGADDSYFFDLEYFQTLFSELKANSHLFVALRAGTIIAGGVFIECDGIVQYHLGGTRDDALALAPMKLIFDTVRCWATEQGCESLHLGGGVGSREDSLFHFKAGFSDRRHEFRCWRWIVCPEQYQRLCSHAERSWHENGLSRTVDGYFPEYRTPTEALQMV